MQGSCTAVAANLLRRRPRLPPCDVFINHRGIDTKRNVAGLLHRTLVSGAGVRAFLDSHSMKPGDRLFDRIDVAIRECKVGVAVFSPMYCHSYFCLHELALMMETRKRVVPVFCDVKPSELTVEDYGAACSPEDLQRFKWALEQAKLTVGLTFDTSRGDWAEFLGNATDVIMKNLMEVVEEEEEEERIKMRQKNENGKYPLMKPHPEFYNYYNNDMTKAALQLHQVMKLKSNL